MTPGPLDPFGGWQRGRGDSLAGRLTRTLIVWVGGVWLLCVLGVVWYVDREINHNFDNELVEVSHRMFDMAAQELDKLQTERPDSHRPLIAPPQLFQTDAVIYQVVDLHERVLLRSAEAPPNTFDVPLTSSPVRPTSAIAMRAPRGVFTARRSFGIPGVGCTSSRMYEV